MSYFDDIIKHKKSGNSHYNVLSSIQIQVWSWAMSITNNLTFMMKNFQTRYKSQDHSKYFDRDVLNIYWFSSEWLSQYKDAVLFIFLLENLRQFHDCPVCKIEASILETSVFIVIPTTVEICRAETYVNTFLTCYLKISECIIEIKGKPETDRVSIKTIHLYQMVL